MLINLIGNAVKFTERGEIVLRVARVEETDTDASIKFSVADTGIGISPEAQAQLFRPFTQADDSMTRRYGGTGLGLAICKQLVEMMGGEISVTSELGNGATFAFTAKFGKQEQVPGPATPLQSDLKGRFALIVDDNDTNRRILQYQLANWGMRTLNVPSGSTRLPFWNGNTPRAIPSMSCCLIFRCPTWTA